MLVVIDANVLLVSVSAKSKYRWLYNLILQQKIQIAFSNEILTEYEEVITNHWHADVAKDVIRSLIELSSTQLTVAYFKLNLIDQDVDDNKFAGCAFAANATFIVTNDGHFNVLKNIPFQAIEVLSLEEFKAILIESNILEGLL